LIPSINGRIASLRYPDRGIGFDFTPVGEDGSPRVVNMRVSPPVGYTSALKRRQMRERHLPGRPSDYQEDHLFPLELGGHPTDPRNLWPQPLAQAQRKDRLELALNRAVCAGRMALGVAQQRIKDPAAWK
jgi:hypothetical protein